MTDIVNRLRSLHRHEAAELAMLDAAQEIIGLRVSREKLLAAITTYLRENDPEDFGCACEPKRTCGPCGARNRQKVLRDALVA